MHGYQLGPYCILDLLGRMLSKCFDKLKMLRRHCALTLDNTFSNNKNSLMLTPGLGIRLISKLLYIMQKGSSTSNRIMHPRKL